MHEPFLHHCHSFPILKDHSQSAKDCASAHACNLYNEVVLTREDLTIVVDHAATDLVRSGTSQHAGRRFLRVEVLDVSLSLRVRAV